MDEIKQLKDLLYHNEEDLFCGFISKKDYLIRKNSLEKRMSELLEETKMEDTYHA